MFSNLKFNMRHYQMELFSEYMNMTNLAKSTECLDCQPHIHCHCQTTKVCHIFILSLYSVEVPSTFQCLLSLLHNAHFWQHNHSEAYQPSPTHLVCSFYFSALRQAHSLPKHVCLSNICMKTVTAT